jgi:hypothetical protein
MDLHSLWGAYSFMDRFATICVAFASAAPIFNANKPLSNSQESKLRVKTLTGIFRRLKHEISSQPLSQMVSIAKPFRKMDEDEESYEASEASGSDTQSISSKSTRFKRRPSSPGQDSPSRT